jgi:glutathione S-transferase
MADIIAFATLEFAERLNHLRPREDQEALLAWKAACEARPSAKA